MALWPFSYEVVVVGRFSKLGEQAREQEEVHQEEVDPQVVRAVLLQVARDRHSERDRVSYTKGQRQNVVRGA